jgi:hypothetical protein
MNMGYYWGETRQRQFATVRAEHSRGQAFRAPARPLPHLHNTAIPRRPNPRRQGAVSPRALNLTYTIANFDAEYVTPSSQRRQGHTS